ncbi:coiled-coil domain-containing protein 55-domain containing protein [Fennellomyces sp. T-0311]|nr:coiled-coil domain-containing protein 55-domain containing protein [Fennellomyces sp. T-0311]
MKFGLNVKSKKPRGLFTPRNTFQQDDDSDVEEAPNDQKAHRSNVNQQLSKSSTVSKKIAEQHAKALEEDANIFDYDSVYDDLKEAERLKKEAMKGPETKKPKYIEGLLEMAEIRKKDRLLAEEKKVAREREAEGEEFADKEVFQTEAFKKQKEELERIEAEEKKREEEQQKNQKMASFFKQVLDKKDAERAALMQHLKTRKDQPQQSSQQKQELDTELAQQAEKEGKQVMLNDNNEIVDRRQLLGAGLNVRPKFGSLGSLSDQRAQERQREYDEYKRKKVEEYEKRRRGGRDDEERERFSREIERQMMETKEKERQAEEEKQKELEQKATAKRTTDEAAMSARERYLARKKQKLQAS